MKMSFRLALKIYKYLLIIFAVGFFIYMIIDDMPLFKYVHGISGALFNLWIYLLYVIVFSLLGSVYYWVAASIVILAGHKIFKQAREGKNIK